MLKNLPPPTQLTTPLGEGVEIKQDHPLPADARHTPDNRCDNI